MNQSVKNYKTINFGRITNEELEWIILDSDKENMLLTSVWSFGNDNPEYLNEFFKNNMINKFFNEEELKRLLEVRLMEKDEFDKYGKEMDLLAPYSWYLAPKKSEGEKTVFEIVSRNNAKSMTEVVKCVDKTFEIIANYKNGKFVNATYNESEGFKEASWNYAIRPVIRIKCK